jgi:steroid delta-isomerase-like uncharacterized protein
MTSEEIHAFCERYAHAVAHSDPAALAACYSENCEVVSPIFGVVTSRSKVDASFRDLFRAFTDMTVQVNDVIVDHARPNRAVLLFTAFGVHRGEIFGVAGTGRRFEIRGAFVFTFDGDRICKETRLYDFTGMLMQLGILKAKAS